MDEGQMEFLKQQIDEKVGVWLTANGISHETQMDMDYSGYDDEVHALLRQGLNLQKEEL